MNLEAINPLFISLIFSIGINLLFFIIAFTFKTDKVTDLSYSLSFVLITLFLIFSITDNKSLVQLSSAFAIIIWGIRLGSYLLIRILKTKTDYRFDDKRNNPSNLIRFWVLQTLAVWLIMLPHSIFLRIENIKSYSTISIVGFIVFVVGFIIESVSDFQKFKFKNNPQNSGKWIDSGLWNYSRHPNYLGEILTWWGLFIVVLPYISGLEYLSIFGPIVITLLLLFISGIPLLEKSADKRYGNNNEYLKYKKTTSKLFILPKRDL